MLICAMSSVKIWQQVEKVSPAFLHKKNNVDVLYTHPVVQVLLWELELELVVVVVVVDGCCESLLLIIVLENP
jgi:hypothetical protein